MSETYIGFRCWCCLYIIHSYVYVYMLCTHKMCACLHNSAHVYMLWSHMQCLILCDRGQGLAPKGAALANLSLSALSLAAHITGLQYQGGFLCCVPPGYIGWPCGM